MSSQGGAWIVADAIRNIKTPTVELMNELIAVFKLIHGQSHPHMTAIALTLTQRIHEACIHETTSVNDFPAKIYGRFCDSKSPFIVRDLIPFLAEKLFASAEHDTHHIITYVNALGNLGHDAAALHHLKASVNLQLQYINTPETLIPKNWFWKQTVKTETHRIEYVESSVYVQGAEYFLNKAYEAYNSMMTGEDKSQYDANKNYIRNILRVENRVAMPPAAHMSVKVLGLQRFFSI